MRDVRRDGLRGDTRCDAAAAPARHSFRAVGQWWRGSTALRDSILHSMDVEPLTLELAKRSGEALARVAGATLVDAIVMASAASRGDLVYSSDVEDLERLQAHFPGVRVLRP